jgi:6-phosphofructokinase 1
MKLESQNIAISYAHEDELFVQEVCDMLRKFYGLDHVFCCLGSPPAASPASSPQAAKTNGLNAFYSFLETATALVCFTRAHGVREMISTAQNGELMKWQDVINARAAGVSRRYTIHVALPGDHRGVSVGQGFNPALSDRLAPPLTDNCSILVRDYDRAAAEQVAAKVIRCFLFGKTEESWEAGRNRQLFTYEKNMIECFHDLARLTPQAPFIGWPEMEQSKLLEKIKSGLPIRWPCIRLRTDSLLQINPLMSTDTVGAPRNGLTPLLPSTVVDPNCPPDQIVAAALSKHHDHKGLRRCMLDESLCLLEAGPRKELMDLQRAVCAGIVVSGGIAPGINAVIDGIVQRHTAYHNKLSPNEQSRIRGFRHGFWGLTQPGELDTLRVQLTPAITAQHATEGGSFLETSRLEDLQHNENKLAAIMNSLRGLDVLYVIGGDGTMKAAEMLTRRAAKERLPLSIVGVPKTMDNDVLWVWQSFGFATAVEKAREVISNLWTEVRSNPRVCVLQVFGSASGFVVSHAVLASQTHCDAALIPEIKFSLEALVERVARRIETEQRAVPFGFIVMAETAVPMDAEKYMYDTRIGLTQGERDQLTSYLPLMKKDNSYAEGSAHDDLRSGALKLVSKGLELGLKARLSKNQAIHLERLRVFTNEPRHILRATGPSFSDIIMGQRLGALAVDNAMAGYSDFMISQWLTEYVLVPLRLAALGRKRIPPDGIFWKSVLAKTGQGDLCPSASTGTVVP